jgi:hypothetical protein
MHFMMNTDAGAVLGPRDQCEMIGAEIKHWFGQGPKNRVLAAAPLGAYLGTPLRRISPQYSAFLKRVSWPADLDSYWPCADSPHPAGDLGVFDEPIGNGGGIGVLYRILPQSENGVLVVMCPFGRAA